MFEQKLLISYIVICITYTACRLHYLLTQKEDEEFNSMLEELINLSGSDDIIITFVIFQIIFSPITAPLSLIKQLSKLVIKIFKNKD